jgi:hypothetical protein
VLLHIVEEVPLPLLGELKEVHTRCLRVVDDLVVDVRDVHHQLHVVAEVVPQDLQDHVVACVVSTSPGDDTWRGPNGCASTRWGRMCTSSLCCR